MSARRCSAGRSAARSNLLNIVRLAWASGAVVIPAYAERLAGARFRVTYLPPVELAPAGPGTIPLPRCDDNVDRLDRVITPIVLAHLHHWYMLFDYYRAEAPTGGARSSS